MKKQTIEQVEVLNPGREAPPAGADRAGRINWFHRQALARAEEAIRCALAAGLELHAAKHEVEHGLFQTWVAKNCEFDQRTGRRYMQLVEGLVGARLPKLVEGPERAAREIAGAAREVDGKTLSELYADLGIVKPYISKMGGARPGAGRPRQDLPAEKLAGAAWGDLGPRIDKAMAWKFTRYLPPAMAREALDTITLLREALTERLAETKASAVR